MPTKLELERQIKALNEKLSAVQGELTEARKPIDQAIAPFARQAKEDAQQYHLLSKAYDEMREAGRELSKERDDLFEEVQGLRLAVVQLARLNKEEA